MQQAIESYIAAALLTSTGLIAFVFSAYHTYLFCQSKGGLSPFCAICQFRCFGHIINSIIYGVVCSLKIIYYQSTGNVLNVWILDGLVLLPFIIMAPTELILALNRFTALFYWSSYTTIFSIKNSTISMVIVWLVAITYFIIRSILGCAVSFSAELLMFKYSSVHCSDIDQATVRFFFLPIMALAGITNLTTFTKVIKRLMSSTTNSNENHHRRLKSNSLLFAQCAVQNITWTTSAVLWSLAVVNGWDTSRIVSFLLIPLPEIVAHAGESIVIVVFHIVTKHRSPGSTGSRS